MTSTNIIKAVAAETGMTQKDIKKAVDALEIAVKSAVANGDSFKAIDVSFSLVDVAARECRNPSNGKTFMADAHKKVKTKLSADYKRIGR